jgi:hypothetical protein
MIILVAQVFCLCANLSSTSGVFQAQANASKPIRSVKISGSEFASIEAAYRVLCSLTISDHQKDLSNYEITVWQKGEYDFVMLWAKIDHGEPITTDSSLTRNGAHLTFTVRRAGHKVVRSLSANPFDVPPAR